MVVSMLTLVLGLSACVAAAPHFYHEHHHHSHHHNLPPPPPPQDLDYFALQYHFDAPRFWSQLSRELMDMEKILEDFYKRFPSNREGVVENEYVITIDLPGFEEKDIVVQRNDQLLMIKANQKPEDDSRQHISEKRYMDVRTLPSYVQVTDSGIWTYSENVLKIVFPLKDRPTTVETTIEVTTPEVTTEGHSREEMDLNTNTDETVGNADVGADNNQDRTKFQDSEIETNEIATNDIVKQTVEATTFKNDFEYVNEMIE